MTGGAQRIAQLSAKLEEARLKREHDRKEMLELLDAMINGRFARLSHRSSEEDELYNRYLIMYRTKYVSTDLDSLDAIAHNYEYEYRIHLLAWFSARLEDDRQETEHKRKPTGQLRTSRTEELYNQYLPSYRQTYASTNLSALDKMIQRLEIAVSVVDKRQSRELQEQMDRRKAEDAVRKKQLQEAQDRFDRNYRP